MSEPSAYIRDHQSLIDLNNTLEYTADSVLKILEQVDSYLRGVKSTLESQMKVLEDELRTAEEELSEAERALSDCEASQKWDEEEEEYRPSCNWQAGRVRVARENRDKCQERVNEAQAVVRDCEYEIEQYKYPGGIFHMPPPGGEKTLEELAKDHTDRATAKMREILEVVEEYLRFNMSLRPDSPCLPDSGDAPLETSRQQLTPEQKKVRFQNAVQKIIDRQDGENFGTRQLADANRVMRCSQCGRPPVACICSNKREEEYTRERIQIIDKDFSR